MIVYTGTEYTFSTNKKFNYYYNDNICSMNNKWKKFKNISSCSKIEIINQMTDIVINPIHCNKYHCLIKYKKSVCSDSLKNESFSKWMMCTKTFNKITM